MSRRHQQQRRRSYGRRQHELHERRDRLGALRGDEREVAGMAEREPAPDQLARFTFGAALLGWAEGAV